MFIFVFILVFVVLSLLAGAVFVCSAGVLASLALATGIGTLCVIIYAFKQITMDIRSAGVEGYILVVFLTLIFAGVLSYAWGWRFDLLPTWLSEWGFAGAYAFWDPYIWYIAGGIALISFGVAALAAATDDSK